VEALGGMTAWVVLGIVLLVVAVIAFSSWLSIKWGEMRGIKNEAEKLRLSDQQKSHLVEELREINRKSREERDSGRGPFDASPGRVRQFGGKLNQVAGPDDPQPPKP